MNELETLRHEYQELNNKRIKLQTIVEQATQACAEIEEKYNIKNEKELQELLSKKQAEYESAVTTATEKVVELQQALLPYEGVI